MAVVQAKPEVKQAEVRPDRLDEKLMKEGKYEVTPEDTFLVEVWLKRTDKRWTLCNGGERGSIKEEVVFRMWTYDEMVELRKMATNFDPIKRIHMVDNDILNRMKIQRFMVSWTFDRENPRLRIQHVNGVMTDESWRAFTRLHPNICTYLIERMNAVYEFNG
jgi:23S rRNA A1618 N6-methylase RlmF